jgi:hypothetical protein
MLISIFRHCDRGDGLFTSMEPGEDYVMKKIALAAGIGAACLLGVSAPARAQGKNPEGVNPEHYECYQVTGQLRALPVRLKDQFGSTEARVVKPVYLCNPVQKNDQPIKDERTHLVCYQIVGPKQANKAVRVVNQFGTQPLKVTAPQLLCVPSLKEVLK